MSNKRPKLRDVVNAFNEVYDHIGGTVEAVGKKNRRESGLQHQSSSR